MKGFGKCAALLCAAAVGMGVFAACGSSGDKGGGTAGPASAFVAVDINPSVEFTLDGKGRVVSVRAANADAEVMLVDVNLKGLTVEEAAKRVVELATAMGYINETNKDVKILAVTEDAALEEKVNADAADGAKLANDTVTIFTESTKSLEREVRKLKETDAALYQDLTPAKLRLIKAAQRYDRALTVEQGAGMKVSELMNVVKTAHDDYEELLTEELERQYEKLEEKKTAEIQARIDALYGEEYAALAGIRRALDDKLDALEDELESRAENAEFTEAEIAELVALLGLADDAALRADGKITYASVEACYERLEDEYDESEDEEDEAMEEKLDALEDWLEAHETEFDEDTYAFTETERGEIEALIRADAEAPALSTFAEAEEYLDGLEDRLEALRASVEADMTKETKAEIAAAEKELDRVEEAVKREMKTAVAQAKEELKHLKSEKLNNGKAA